MAGVKVLTMIDNVRIAARNRETFLDWSIDWSIDWSMAGSCAGTLTTPIAAISERQWLEYGRSTKIFLGEEVDIANACVRNALKNSEKLMKAWAKLLQATQYPSTISYRNVIALLSLLF
jgi:hypothetical protein